MGTNYYYHANKTNYCPHCGRGDDEPKHIGKSSAGWCFALHVYPEDGIHDLLDWERLFDEPNAVIKNEYGEVIKRLEMVQIITKRSWIGTLGPGPNNLLRCRLGDGCIKHGEGTWDCVVGEFS